MPDTIVPKSATRFGFWPGLGKPNKEQLEKDRKKDSALARQITNNTLTELNEKYFQQLKNLCVTNNIKLYFLYLSDYGNSFTKPLQNDFYLKYGEVLSVPDSILNEFNCFSDYAHFNLNGANKTSLWLVKALEE